MERISANEVLKNVKKEFNAHKNNGCVIISDFTTANFGYPESLSEMEAAKKAAREVINSLRNTRGIYSVNVEDANVWINGSFAQLPTCVRLIRKPCKEFLQLNNYLTKYATAHLGLTGTKTQYVGGKRNCYEVESESLLAHNSKECSAILSWLREKKATTCNILLSHHTYKERSAGYEMECEWSGTFTTSLIISLQSKKTGKVKDKKEFFA